MWFTVRIVTNHNVTKYLHTCQVDVSGLGIGGGPNGAVKTLAKAILVCMTLPAMPYSTPRLLLQVCCDIA